MMYDLFTMLLAESKILYEVIITKEGNFEFEVQLSKISYFLVQKTVED